MIYSRKLRLTAAAPASQTESPGVNDNMPGRVAGHEMSDLDNVPRPPAAETVLHYSRVAAIGSYPEAHASEAELSLSMPGFDAVPQKVETIKPRRGLRTISAGCVSLIAHAALFSFLAMAMVAEPEEPEEEAGSVVSVTMLGDAEFDQLMAGDPDVIEAEPVEVDELQPSETQPAEAEPVQPEEVAEAVLVETTQAQPVEAMEAQPVDVASAEPVETQTTQPVQATEAQPVETVVEAVPTQSTIVQAEAVPALEPEILTSAVPAEPIVTQPISAATPQTAEPVETAEAMPVTPTAQPAETAEATEATPVMPTVQPVETMQSTVATPVTPVDEIKPIEEKPVAKKPVEKKKPVAKKPAEKPKSRTETKTKAGAGGQAEQDRKRGSTDGQETAKSNSNGSKNAGRNSSISGSRAVANYPGKVQSKIRRSVRVPSAFKRERTSMSVKVRLTIGSSGQLSSVSVARSSGVAELDRAVVDGVRRAAPFPPLPAEWGKPSWSFSQEVQVTGR